MSAIVIFLIFSMLSVIWFDGTRYIIPNWLVGLMLFSYPVAVFMAHSGVDWKMALAAAMAILIAGYIIFALKFMGAGDIKLMTACALWVGAQHVLDFLIAVSLLGGVLAVSVLFIRKAIPFLPKKIETLPRIFRDREPVPYGIAIAIGFLIMMWAGEVPVIL